MNQIKAKQLQANSIELQSAAARRNTTTTSVTHAPVVKAPPLRHAASTSAIPMTPMTPGTPGWIPMTPMTPGGLNRMRSSNDLPEFARARVEPAVVPVPQSLKLIINTLMKESREITVDELKDLTGIDLRPGNPSTQDLVNAVKNNPKISFEDGVLVYRSKYGVTNKEELLELIEKSRSGLHQNGLKKDELTDSYKGIENDIKTLHEARKIFIVRNNDAKTDILYSNVYGEKESYDDLRDLWQKIDVAASEIDLQLDMKKAGISTTVSAGDELMKRQGLEAQAEGKQKKKRKTKAGKMHNTHVIALLQDEKPAKK